MKRWVLSLAIAVVVAVVAAGAYEWIFSTGNTAPNTPCEALECGGPTLPAFGSPVESSSNGHHLYNFSVESAGGGLVWGDLAFDYLNSNGAYAGLGSQWAITIFGPHGETVATFFFYSGSGGAWSLGADVTVTSQQALLVSGPSDQSMSGGSFVVYADGGGFSGTVTIAVP